MPKQTKRSRTSVPATRDHQLAAAKHSAKKRARSQKNTKVYLEETTAEINSKLIEVQSLYVTKPTVERPARMAEESIHDLANVMRGL